MQTRLFLPSWWVRSYEAALLNEHASAAARPFFTGRILPASSCFEVHVLSLLIAYVQKQLLDGGAPRQPSAISIDLGQLVKELGAPALSRKGLREDLLLGLGGLKILHEQGAHTFGAYPLFRDERWGYGQGSTELRVNLSPLAEELFCGYAHAYADFARLLGQKERSRLILAEEPPLLLWRSLWLDLQGNEQALVLRLEMAMQWAYRCLQLDGVFGEEVDVLFAGLKGPGRVEPNLPQKLKILQRLLRKLHEHGFLQSYGEADYLAFGQHDAGLQLVWKVAPHRFLGEDHASYMAGVSSLFTRLTCNEDDFATCLPLTLGLKEGQRYSLVSKIMGCLAKSEAKDLTKSCQVIEGNVIVPLVLLFLEWSLRKSGEHAVALPEVVLRLIGPSLLAETDDSAGLVGEKLVRFTRQFAELPELSGFLERQPLATLVAKISQSDELIMKLQQGYRELSLGGRRPALTPISSELKTVAHAADAFKPAMVSGGISKALGGREVSGRALGQAGGVEKIAAGAEQASEPFRRRSQPANMRAQVVEKLESIKKSAPTHYQELTKAYLQSLDEASRRLILDIKQRMQPPIFEKHLQQRLIQFMLEHPYAWQDEGHSLDQENISK